MRRLLEHVGRVLRGPAAGDPPGRAWAAVGVRTGLTLVCGALYGGAMGSFGWTAGDRPGQVLVSAAKVPLLLLVTFALSLPSFFVLNTLLGVRSDFPAAVRALAGGQAGLTVVLAALAPYTLLWYASFTNYGWALAFNGLMFAVATIAGQAVLRGWYRPLMARSPRHRWLLRAWLVLYAFVAVQMAWVLRPFVGSPGMPVQFFREESWGNAYVIIGRMIWDGLTR
jgi:hypothetical protein